MIDKEKILQLQAEGKVKSTEDLQGIFRNLMKDVIETLYDGELTDHLGYKKYEQKKGNRSNSRNGKTIKKVKSHAGEIELDVPRDRNSTYEPKVVKKYQNDISGIEAKVISMYAKGMTNRDITEHIDEIYGYKLSAETISNITDMVIEKAKEWQNRPLQTIYPIVFMDAFVIKMRVDKHVRNISVYGIIGIDLEGHKECLGLYFSETESAKYWLAVMNELKNRGLEDVLIFAVDNLSGISEAITAAFPKAEIQKCIVHQIRNSLKFVPWKERKQVAADLKAIYTAPTEEAALDALADFEKIWNKKYPHILKSWQNNWDELSTFFIYPQEVRTLIYTTNPIESFNRGIRKVTKNRGAFPSEQAALKLLYLAVEGISKKWSLPIRNWGPIFSQLSIMFEDRLSKYL